MKKTSLLLLTIIGNLHALDIQDKQIMVESKPVHYYQIMSAKPSASNVILLTGYATTANFWNRQFVECLAQKHNVYLYDYAGINQTLTNQTAKESTIAAMAQDVNNFVKAQKINNPTLIGWSMGGAVALNASLDHKYQHLYLISPVIPTKNAELSVYPFKEHAPFTSESSIYNYVFSNNIYGYESSELNRMLTSFIDPQMSKLFPANETMAAQGSALQKWQTESINYTQFIHNHTPATFIVGQNDQVVNVPLITKAIQAYPQHKIIEIKNTGHAVNWQNPQQVCQIIK